MRDDSGIAPGPLNRITGDALYTYQYDSNGNRTRKTTTATGDYVVYVWDPRNRLTSVKNYNALNAIQSQIDYQYDAENRLIQRTQGANVQKYIYEGEKLTAAMDGAGSVKHWYSYGPLADQVLADESFESGAHKVYLTLADQQGSIRDIAARGAAGGPMIVTHREYTAFGELKTETPENGAAAAVDLLFGYTGRYWDDDAKLQNNLNRWYDPRVSQWLSEDPIGFAAGDENTRRYVSNDPVNKVDPSGLEETIKQRTVKRALSRPDFGDSSKFNSDQSGLYNGRIKITSMDQAYQLHKAGAISLERVELARQTLMTHGAAFVEPGGDVPMSEALTNAFSLPVAIPAGMIGAYAGFMRDAAYGYMVRGAATIDLANARPHEIEDYNAAYNLGWTSKGIVTSTTISGIPNVHDADAVRLSAINPYYVPLDFNVRDGLLQQAMALNPKAAMLGVDAAPAHDLERTVVAGKLIEVGLRGIASAFTRPRGVAWADDAINPLVARQLLGGQSLEALEYAGVSSSEIAPQLKAFGDIYLFRGTTTGFAGSPGSQAAGVTPMTIDPLVATAFAAQGASKGPNPVVIFGKNTSFADEILFGNAGPTYRIAEREVSVGISPTEVASRAPHTISLARAQQILSEMNLDLPSSASYESLKRLPQMTPEQIRIFIERATR